MDPESSIKKMVSKSERNAYGSSEGGLYAGGGDEGCVGEEWGGREKNFALRALLVGDDVNAVMGLSRGGE